MVKNIKNIKWSIGIKYPILTTQQLFNNCYDNIHNDCKSDKKLTIQDIYKECLFLEKKGVLISIKENYGRSK